MLYQVRRSKTGLPTVSEAGGGHTNTGWACIICGPDGERLRPIFVPRRGLSCDVHATFVARPGMCLVWADVHRHRETVTVERIIAIGDGNNPDMLTLEAVGEYENGDGNIPIQFEAAVRAAIKKARCYHCREPHYIG